MRVLKILRKFKYILLTIVITMYISFVLSDQHLLTSFITQPSFLSVSSSVSASRDAVCPSIILCTSMLLKVMGVPAFSTE